MARLLLLACSARKRTDSGPLAAQERYDGPAFRVLRRFLAEKPDADLRVLILSARFGLVDASAVVPDYDCKMTAERARELAPQVDERLAALDAAGRYGSQAADCFALLGKQYLDVLARCSSPLARRLAAHNAPGGQGVKLAHLHRWLRMETGGAPPKQRPSASQSDEQTDRPIRFKGKDFAVSSSDLARLLDHHAHPLPRAATNSVWKAVVGGRLVAPKWLVSQATGMAVSTFTTSEARRFLRQAGVEIVSP